MIRHLKNINELIVYASVSCGCAFLVRLIPSFLIPVFLLGFSTAVYYLFIVGIAEKNRLVACVIVGALIVGFLGGNIDYLEIFLRYNTALIGRWVSIIATLILLVIGMVCYVDSRKK
jgi:hypothetical protein